MMAGDREKQVVPTVSVVIPVYNQEPYLAECLDSVLAQTLREIEVVCVDDGSTDSSGRMLDDYAARDSRVVVIHQANAGPGRARNVGIERARGAFVAFMDPDDKYPDEDVLRDLHRGLSANGVEICCGGMCAVGGEPLEREFTFERDGLLDYADYQFEFGYCRALFDRDLLDRGRIRFPDLRRFQDVPFFVRAMRAAGRFYALSRTTYLLRMRRHDVDWTVDGSRKAVDNVDGLFMVDDLARAYGYERMAARIRRRALDFTKHLGCRLDSVQEQLAEAHREIIDIKTGVSFRLGMFLTAPLRKARRLLKGAK